MSVAIVHADAVAPHSLSLGLGICHAQARHITVKETSAEVRVQVTAKYVGPGPHPACMDGAVVELKQPLGDRPVINAATGRLVERGANPGIALPTTSSTTPVDDGCWRPPADSPPSTQFGSVHTIPPRQENASYRISVEPETVCPGGILRINVGVTNNGRGTIDVAPSVVYAGPSINGYEYTNCCPSVRVASKQTRSSIGSFRVPLDADQGTYRLTLRDYGNGDAGATFTVVSSS